MASSTVRKRVSHWPIRSRSSGQFSRRATGEARPEIDGAHHLEGQVSAADLVHTHAGARRAHLLASVQPGGEGHIVGRDQSLEHGDVEPRARTRSRAPPQGGHDGAKGVGSREHVGGLEVGGSRRGQVALLQVHEAGGGVDDVGEGRPLAPRARLAEAGDGAVDEIGLDGGERRVVDAQALGHPGGKILHGHVGLPREIADDVARLRAPEIEPHALLADIDPREIRALIVAARVELEVALAHVVAAPRTLDLDHAGAEVGEEARAVGPGEHAREVEDEEIGKRSGRVGHRASIPEGRERV
jgi:hypothetical protein